MTTRAHTRVVVVDDHQVVRAGISVALLTSKDIELVGRVGDGEAALRLCEEVHPDVVVMDLRLPGMDGISAIRALRQRDPEVGILALTSFPDEYWMQEALQAGATGYLQKNVDLDVLIHAIRAAHPRKQIRLHAPR